jgi:glutamine synthetase
MYNQPLYRPKTCSKYDDLKSMDQNGVIICEYVWIDGTGLNLRSKARSINHPINSLVDVPSWNYDGSSTYQAQTENSEVILQPVAMFKDPFRLGDNLLVMCETMKWKDNTFTELIPANTNFRHDSKPIFEEAED